METVHADKVENVIHFLKSLQEDICQGLNRYDDAQWQEDLWVKEQGAGGGRTRVLSGRCFEKAGVNFSHVKGSCLPPSATETRPHLAGAAFEAMGVSLVIHPHNPFVPTTHANVRLFMAYPQEQEPVFWFGGGYDLTPYYVFEEDARDWHRTAERTLRPLGSHLYPLFKKNCDHYFMLKHRKEMRGIGGIIYDDFQEGGFDHGFALMQAVGTSFLEAYLPIVQRREATPYTEAQKWFQKHRRARYTEFNLLYDRGTVFGLHSGGRTESILMSLPPEVVHVYNYHPPEGSPEAALSQYLQPRDWLAPV